MNLGLHRAESSAASLIVPKEKQSSLLEASKSAKLQNFMQTQTVSHGTLKKFGGSGNGDDNRTDELSPALQYSRN